MRDYIALVLKDHEETQIKTFLALQKKDEEMDAAQQMQTFGKQHILFEVQIEAQRVIVKEAGDACIWFDAIPFSKIL